MDDIEEIWQRTCEDFPILIKLLEDCDSDSTNDDLEYSIRELSLLDITESVYEAIFIEIDCMLRQKVVPSFWSHFEHKCTAEASFYKFHLAISEMFTDYEKFQKLLDRVKLFRQMCRFKKPENKIRNVDETFDNFFRGTLLAQIAANFSDFVFLFYHVSFRVFIYQQRSEDTEQEYLEEPGIPFCHGCDNEKFNCCCEELISAFNETNKHLLIMNLMDKFSGSALTTLTREKIVGYIHNTFDGVFNRSHLNDMENWLEDIILNWLTRIFNEGNPQIDDDNMKTRNIVGHFRIKLNFFIYQTYSHNIIDQLFNIIIDYPDSQMAIEDLKTCLKKIDIRAYLVSTLKRTLAIRLLHPGVNTMDILTGYVAAIKAIRDIDSTGVLLETVTEPVKEYLRLRSDTVRRVVTGLTEEGPSDLADELAKSENLKDNNGEIPIKDEMSDWRFWAPDPADAIPFRSSRLNRSADIISMVVDIYGSKEVFVNEYRNLLADRLLTQLNFQPDKEIRNLELLKLRFGEALLHSCEVMLKDISDSKRINTHIQNDTIYNNEKSFEISSLILSSQFWPTFNKETLELPEEIMNEFKKYTKSYEGHKGNRTLCWRPITGKVVIEIQLSKKTLELSVTPTQAAIIYHFQDKSEWTIDQLCLEMKCPPSILRKRITFWQTHGLIREKDTDLYCLIDEDESNTQHVHAHEICEDDDSESAMASASDQREEELQVFWSYIVGMLTNLDSLPIERIHQMLKMFASHGPGIEFSEDELKNFLQRKVREHKLMFTGGVYQMPK